MKVNKFEKFYSLKFSFSTAPLRISLSENLKIFNLNLRYEKTIKTQNTTNKV